jgi:hypothetical protein
MIMLPPTTIRRVKRVRGMLVDTPVSRRECPLLDIMERLVELVKILLRISDMEINRFLDSMECMGRWEVARYIGLIWEDSLLLEDTIHVIQFL